MQRAALHAKQLLSFRRDSKSCACAAELQNGAPRTEGWTIKAMLKPSRLRVDGSDIRRALLRPLEAVRRQRHRRTTQVLASAASCEDSQRGGPLRDSLPSDSLQHALSIEPVCEEQENQETSGQSAGSLGALLGAAGGHHAQRPLLLAHQARSSIRQGHLAALHSLGGPAAAAGQDSLASALAELAAMQQTAAQLAALLAQYEACAAGMRQQEELVQGQLSECEAEIAAAERQAADAAAAAGSQPGRQAVADKIDALQHELRRLASCTTTEQQRLQAAAEASRHRTEALNGAAHDCFEAAAGWRHRVELMESSHQPLTREEQWRHDRSMQRYYTRGA